MLVVMQTQTKKMLVVGRSLNKLDAVQFDAVGYKLTAGIKSDLFEIAAQTREGLVHGLRDFLGIDDDSARDLLYSLTVEGQTNIRDKSRTVHRIATNRALVNTLLETK